MPRVSSSFFFFPHSEPTGTACVFAAEPAVSTYPSCQRYFFYSRPLRKTWRGRPSATLDPTPRVYTIAVCNLAVPRFSVWPDTTRNCLCATSFPPIPCSPTETVRVLPSAWPSRIPRSPRPPRTRMETLPGFRCEGLRLKNNCKKRNVK